MPIAAAKSLNWFKVLPRYIASLATATKLIVSTDIITPNKILSLKSALVGAELILTTPPTLFIKMWVWSVGNDPFNPIRAFQLTGVITLPLTT